MDYVMPDTRNKRQYLQLGKSYLASTSELIYSILIKYVHISLIINVTFWVQLLSFSAHLKSNCSFLF